MKAVSQTYKDNIKELGREIDAKITYTLNSTTYTLNAEDINSISYHYEGTILKSVMKQLDIDSNQEIPVGTILECQFGVLVNNQYEYINYGNFIVYSSEKQEDTLSYKLICYDKMLYAMKDYEAFATFPITIRSYIDDLCTHLNLTFGNSSDTFANYDKEITNELYLDNEGNSLDYTFRDVLDELAQVTASTICINNNDELELRYINDTQDTIDEEYLKDINVNFGEMTSPINTITFKRSEADAISLSNPIDLADDLKNEICISNNQILNNDNRDEFLQDILDELYGLTYSLNDFSSTGITFYELCDKYNVLIDNNTYTCIMFNDEVNITQGLEEHIYTDKPEESITDYNTTTRSDRLKNRTDLIVNKQEGQISAVTGVLDIRDDGTSEVIEGIIATQNKDRFKIEAITTKEIKDGEEVYTGVKTGKGFTFDNNGLSISDVNDENTYKTLLNEQGTYYYDGDEILGQTTNDGSKFKNMDLFGEFRYGKDDINDDAMFIGQLYTAQWTDNDGVDHSEKGFGHFYNES